MPFRASTTGNTKSGFGKVAAGLVLACLSLGQAAWAGSPETRGGQFLSDSIANSIADSSSSSKSGSDSESASNVDKLAVKDLTGSINNFDIVSRGVWRGAAPSDAALNDLAAHGVKTIVDLRLTGLGTIEEQAHARKLGLNYVHIPLGYRGPTMAKLAQFLSLVENPEAQPVYVHCRYGSDRTGTLIGCFRVVHDHWTFDQAYNEMKSHHFKPWFTGMKKLVARVDADPRTRKTLMVLTEQDFYHRRMAVKASPRG